MSTTPRNPQTDMHHLDEVTGLLYVEGQLEQDAARDVVSHLQHCAACRQLLDLLKRESLLLREALTEVDEPLPARLLALPVSEGLSWGWLTVFVLAGLGAYTMWSFYVQPSVEAMQESGFGGQFFFTWLLLNGAMWRGWNDMLQILMYGSMGVLAFLLLLLFRRNLRRLSSLSIFLAALVLPALAHPPAAHAAEFLKRQSAYEIPTGQTVKNDIFILASSVRIDGTLDGDLVCFCHTLSVEGRVTGDVIAFANSVRITGKVDGNVRSFNQHLSIEGEIAHNILSFVGQFESTPRSNVTGSATLFVAHMNIDGPIGKSLSAYVGDGSINAPVGGDVRLRGGQGEHTPVTVTSHADIKGGFWYRGPRAPDISSGAKIAGSPQIEIVKEVPEYLRASSYRYNVMIWGIAFVVGLFLISIAPVLVQETAREVTRVGPPLAFGLIAWIVLPIGAVICCITIVGLGLGVTAFLVWLFMVFFAQVFTAVALGEAILGVASGAWPVAGRLALGLFVLRAAALLPGIGLLVRFLSCVFGMGALAIVLYNRMQKRTALPPAPAPLAATPAP